MAFDIEETKGHLDATMLFRQAVRRGGGIREAMAEAGLPYDLDDVRRYVQDAPTTQAILEHMSERDRTDLEHRLVGMVAGAMLVAERIARLGG